MKRLKGKIAYCDNKYLHGLNHIPGGHYVYIRKVNKYGYCDVNVVTSLEDNNGKFNFLKLKHVKRGNTYPIPKYDSNFSRWSGINKQPIRNVKLNNLTAIGRKKIKKRHFFFIGKYMQ